MTPEKLVELLQHPKVTGQLSEMVTDPAITRGLAELLKDPAIRNTLAGIVDVAGYGFIVLVVLGGLNLLGLIYVAAKLRKLGGAPPPARPPGAV